MNEPIWQEANMTWQEFSNRNLNEPGTLVEVDGDCYLIGDINTLRGVCDDCTAFDKKEIVSRYKVLVEKDWK